jgi:lipoprotein-anchoring transpeptidase ErfK/SrfK
MSRHRNEFRDPLALAWPTKIIISAVSFAVAFVTTLLLANHGDDLEDNSQAVAVPVPSITPVPVVAARSVPNLDALPQATTYATTPEAPADVNLQEIPAGTVVHPRARIPAFTEPGGPAFAVLPPQEISSDTWVPVIATESGWVQVLLPSRPNGSTGWLSTQDNGLDIAQTPFRIEVDRADFRLHLFRDGQEVGAWTVGVGKSSAPTPTGRTFVMASIQDSRQTYSPVILPLGIHSTSHETFGGGPGTTGIHTWPTANVFGTQSSDGCIRIPADALHVLATTVPLGTVVLIH